MERQFSVQTRTNNFEGKKEMKSIFVSLLIMMLVFNGCASLFPPAESIHIKGSETMLSLTQRLAEEYNRTHPHILFNIEGGGTSAGLKALASDKTVICTASRIIEPGEIKSLANNFHTVGVSTSIAKDAICIYVNKINKVKDFSLRQLMEIFMGKITNWKDIGGNDQDVKIFLRNDDSGTLQQFKNLVLENRAFAIPSKTYTSVIDLIQAVEGDESSITFAGLSKEEGTKCSVENITPTSENINNSIYPLTRYLYFITAYLPEDKIKSFINWVIGPEGQEIIRQEGFIPLFNYSFD
jgi:phosphate transport system substrate-binding protein